MPIDRQGEPWSDATYRGFAAPGPDAPRGPEPRRRLPSISRNGLILGAAVAVALGLVFGLWARPNLQGGAGASQPDLAAPGRAVPIEVAHPAPPPQPRGGKLDVLPSAPAQIPRAEAAPTPAPAGPQAAEDAATSAPSEASGPPLPRLAPPPPLPAIQRPPPEARASDACATARPGAELMVCEDPGLSAADRELARSYRRALASGAPPGAIRADQRDWLAIREDAARHSRRALAEVYQQRIDELNQIAQDPGGPADDDDGGPGY